MLPNDVLNKRTFESAGCLGQQVLTPNHILAITLENNQIIHSGVFTQDMRHADSKIKEIQNRDWVKNSREVQYFLENGYHQKEIQKEMQAISNIKLAAYQKYLQRGVVDSWYTNLDTYKGCYFIPYTVFQDITMALEKNISFFWTHRKATNQSLDLQNAIENDYYLRQFLTYDENGIYYAFIEKPITADVYYKVGKYNQNHSDITSTMRKIVDETLQKAILSGTQEKGPVYQMSHPNQQKYRYYT